MRKRPRIAVVGGGPGGLTLARVLQTRGVAATVFEMDASPDERPQGGTLDMHPDSGQLALRLAGLMPEFERIARYEDQETRLYDKAGNCRFDAADEAGEGDRPEVDRAALRRILLDSLAPDAVRWGHKLRAVQAGEDGAFDLAFTDSHRETFDFVVGADGAWSRVRPLVSAERPRYCGVTFVEMGIDDVDRRLPDIAHLVGRGSMFALGDAKGLIAQRNSNAHVRIYAAFRVPEEWAAAGSGIDFSTAAPARRGLLALFADWSPRLRSLIAECDDRLVPRALYALPVGHRWASRPGVTLIGDAAHVMSPFSGEGANLAMRDGADLALALADSTDGNAAVQGFERTMLDRAQAAAAGAASAMDSAFSDRGLEAMVEIMQGHRGGASPA